MDSPLPLISAGEYPFLRFAVDVVDRLAAKHGFDPADVAGNGTGESPAGALERVRVALWLYEPLPPA